VIEKLHPSAEGKGFQVGDRVGFLYIVDGCYECDGCLTHNMLCVTGKAKVQGLNAHGFFADYAVQDWQNLAKLPKEVALEKCSPIFCAGITGECRVVTRRPWTDLCSISLRRQLRTQTGPVARGHWRRRPGSACNAICQGHGSQSGCNRH